MAHGSGTQIEAAKDMVRDFAVRHTFDFIMGDAQAAIAKMDVFGVSAVVFEIEFDHIHTFDVTLGELCAGVDLVEDGNFVEQFAVFDPVFGKAFYHAFDIIRMDEGGHFAIEFHIAVA